MVFLSSHEAYAGLKRLKNHVQVGILRKNALQNLKLITWTASHLYFQPIYVLSLSYMKMEFRKAIPEDAALILEFIRKLAEYERLSDLVVADEATLREWIFEKGKAEVLFVLLEGEEVGYALYFYNFSTFLGRAGLYIEDLYVKPEHRGKGCGKALFKEIAGIAAREGCGRVEWWCLDWNRPSIDFYKSFGAEAMDEWTVYRLAGDPLESLK